MVSENFLNSEIRIFRRFNPADLPISEFRLNQYFQHVNLMTGLDLEKIKAIWKENRYFEKFLDACKLEMRRG